MFNYLNKIYLPTLKFKYFNL